MTRGPRRLKADSDFQWETGCDLSDEELVVGGYPHERMRSRLLAAVALAPPTELSVGDGMPSVRVAESSAGAPVAPVPGPWLWAAVRPAVGALAGAVMVAGAYWLGVQAGAGVGPEQLLDPDPAPLAAEIPVAPTPAPSPSVVSPPAPVEPAPEVPAEGTAAPDAPTPAPAPLPPTPAHAPAALPSAPVSPPSGTADPAPVPEVGPGGVSDAAPVAAIAAVEPTGTAEAAPDAGGTADDRPVSRFAEEARAFDQARDALARGRHEEARDLFTAYLERFPAGSMRPEAELGRLQAVRGAGDLEALAALAAELQDVPALAGRREEIVRLRAESLVELGRCAEAMAVSEDLPARPAAEIRRACRASRRE